MDTPQARFKLDEARFLRDRLADKDDKLLMREPWAFRFYLSTFLNACYSIVEKLEGEMTQQLDLGLERERTIEGERFTKWLANWSSELGPEQGAVWKRMRLYRHDEVHREGVHPVAQTKLVAVPRSEPRMLTPWLMSALAGPPSFVPATDRVRTLRELSEYEFRDGGEHRNVVETCDHYLALLGRLVGDAQAVEKL